MNRANTEEELAKYEEWGKGIDSQRMAKSDRGARQVPTVEGRKEFLEMEFKLI
jgi:hypothetical protein